MKTKCMSIICVLLYSLLSSSCNKNFDEQEEEKQEPVIEIQAFYSVSNIEKPLISAPVYVYIGLSPIDFYRFTYGGNGRYTNKDKTILPDQILETDNKGKVTFSVGYIEIPISIFIENKINNTLSYSNWPYCNKDVKEKIIFYINK